MLLLAPDALSALGAAHPFNSSRCEWLIAADEFHLAGVEGSSPQHLPSIFSKMPRGQVVQIKANGIQMHYLFASAALQQEEEQPNTWHLCAEQSLRSSLLCHWKSTILDLTLSLQLEGSSMGRPGRWHPSRCLWKLDSHWWPYPSTMFVPDQSCQQAATKSNCFNGNT